MDEAKPLPEGYTYLRGELRFEHTLLGNSLRKEGVGIKEFAAR